MMFGSRLFVVGGNYLDARRGHCFRGGRYVRTGLCSGRRKRYPNRLSAIPDGGDGYPNGPGHAEGVRGFAMVAAFLIQRVRGAKLSGNGGYKIGRLIVRACAYKARVERNTHITMNSRTHVSDSTHT